MSTYVYLECLDHDPPLRADNESGQHLTDLPRIRAEIANRETVADSECYYRDDVPGHYFEADGYFHARSARFLAAHPKCRIGIRDEYGVEHSVVNEETR